MRLTLPRERYPGDAAGAFFDRLSERLAALPGVRAVSAASQFPPSATFGTQFRLEHGRKDGQQTLPTALITVGDAQLLRNAARAAARRAASSARPIASTRRPSR